MSSRRRSISSVITIPQPPTNPSDRASRETPTNIAPSTSLGSSDIASTPEKTESTVEPVAKDEDETDTEDLAHDLEDDVEDLGEKENEGKEENLGLSDTEERDKVRDMSLSQLEGRGFGGSQRTMTNRSPAIAKIVLREEKATIFHDFLKFVYPQYVARIFLKLAK